MEKVLDPKYGHTVGPHVCHVKDCKGHVTAASATIHRLYEEYYTSTRRVRRLRRQEKAEAKIVKATNRKRTRGLAPRVKKATPKVETTTEVKTKKKHKGHYHKGRRGRCSCEKGADK